MPYLSIDFNGKEDLVGINRTNDQASDVESCLCAFLLNPIHTSLYIDVVRSLERPSQIRRVEAIIQYERAYAMIQFSMKEAYAMIQNGSAAIDLESSKGNIMKTAFFFHQHRLYRIGT